MQKTKEAKFSVVKAKSMTIANDVCIRKLL